MKENKKVVIIVMAVILVLGCVGGGIALFTNSDKDSKVVEESDTTATKGKESETTEDEKKATTEEKVETTTEVSNKPQNVVEEKPNKPSNENPTTPVTEAEKPPVTPQHTHNYTSKITKQPTCTSAGVKTYTCNCGNSYTESIAKTNHSWNTQTTTETIHHEAEYEWHDVADDGFDFTAAGYNDDQIAAYQREHLVGFGDMEVMVRDAWDETITHETTTCSVCGATK